MFLRAFGKKHKDICSNLVSPPKAIQVALHHGMQQGVLNLLVLTAWHPRGHGLGRSKRSRLKHAQAWSSLKFPAKVLTETLWISRRKCNTTQEYSAKHTKQRGNKIVKSALQKQRQPHLSKALPNPNINTLKILNPLKNKHLPLTGKNLPKKTSTDHPPSHRRGLLGRPESALQVLGLAAAADPGRPPGAFGRWGFGAPVFLLWSSFCFWNFAWKKVEKRKEYGLIFVVFGVD